MRMPLRLILLSAVLPLVASAALETWSTPSGAPMQAECLGVKGDYVVFKKADGSRALVPFAKLTPADQVRVSSLSYAGPAGTVTVAKDTTGSGEASKIAQALHGKLVSRNGRVLRAVTNDQLAGTQFYAVYFSASWCGPCRRFTPELVAAYPQIKTAHPEFEVIFVSSDEDEDAMRHYMIDDKMPWTALRFNEARTNATLRRYQKSGIPNLVFIDGAGRIISQSYEGDRYVGPQKVLGDIRRHFKM